MSVTTTARRAQLIVILGFGAVLYFGIMLWSTCAGLSCGSLHSSIWPRIGTLCLPFVAFLGFAWRDRTAARPGLGLAVSTPLLAVTTVFSGWEVSSAPATDPNAGAQLSEHTAAVISLLVIVVLMAIPLVLAVALVGLSGFRSQMNALLHTYRGVMLTFVTLGTIAALGLCVTPAFGITGVDVNPATTGGYSSNSSPQGNLYVALRHCSDNRLVNCTLITRNVAQGDSFDLSPGIYTLRSEPPAGISCTTVPATMYLFPFERIQVQFLSMSCGPAQDTMTAP